MAVRATLDTNDPDDVARWTPLAIGKVIGRYRIDAILGHGGMGAVARARDLDLGRDVALKVAQYGNHPERDRRRAELLLREARAMASLRAPHVRAVYDVGTAGGVDYIAMEYIAGVDLAVWLETPRTVAEIVRVFVAAGRGLAAAHAAGILHRDFKPANVMVGEDDTVVVTDFGIASRFGETSPAFGTLYYVAPEPDPDARGDQYSFCVALGDALRLHDSPLAVDEVILRGRDPDPDRRYSSMSEVVAALERAMRPRRWPVLAAIGAAVAAAGVAGVLALRGGDAPGSSSPMFDAFLADAGALADRGYLRSARRAAQTAQAIAPVGRRAVASYRLGDIAALAEDVAVARTALDAAVRLGDEERDDDTRARALLALFQLAATRGSDRAAIDRAEQAADAALTRIAPDRQTRALRAYLRAIGVQRDGRAAARAYAEARAIMTPPDLHELTTWAEIGRSQAAALLGAGDRDAAIAIDRELVVEADRVGGRGHLAALGARGDLAIALEAAGRDAEAAAVMAEMRAAAATPAGARALDEDGQPRPPTRPLRVTVRDPAGTPVGGALVVAALDFNSNGTNLLGAATAFDEAFRLLVTATTDARGEATLAVARDARLWLAADHATGRAPAIVAPADSATLALVPFGALAGRVASGRVTTVHAIPAGVPDAPRVIATADAGGRYSIARIPRGDYTIAACEQIAGYEACRVASAHIGDAPATLDLPPVAGPGALAVSPRDELDRPIESSTVFVWPAEFQPATLAVAEDTWPDALAKHPGAVVAWASVHGAEPAHFANLPLGRYALCAVAVHGDTQDPSLATRLQHTPVPMHCTPVDVTAEPRAVQLAIPAAHRVWLGDPPR
jgi:Protein kinase domain